MIKVFFSMIWPFGFLFFVIPTIQEWDFINGNKQLTSGLVMVTLVALLFYRSAKILANYAMYGSKKDQEMNLRFTEMMKSEGEFTVEGFEKFFPDLAHKEKIK